MIYMPSPIGDAALISTGTEIFTRESGIGWALARGRAPWAREAGNGASLPEEEEPRKKTRVAQGPPRTGKPPWGPGHRGGC